METSNTAWHRQAPVAPSSLLKFPCFLELAITVIANIVKISSWVFVTNIQWDIGNKNIPSIRKKDMCSASAAKKDLTNGKATGGLERSPRPPSCNE